jgi:hypothetical protein
MVNSLGKNLFFSPLLHSTGERVYMLEKEAVKL